MMSQAEHCSLSCCVNSEGDGNFHSMTIQIC